MDCDIIAFLKEQTIACFAVVNNNKPHSFSVFYSYHPETNIFIFKSSPETFHAKFILMNKNISGCINSNDISISNLQGVQFSGTATLLVEDEISLIKNYKNKFPFAIFKSGEYWKCEIDWIKFTNNKLGFGTKKTWKKELQQ